MCINRWCSEQPEKTPSKLTTLARVDQTEIDIFCSDHDSKQTQREYSIVADVFQKWYSLQYCAIFEKVHFQTLQPKDAPSLILLPWRTLIGT